MQFKKYILAFIFAFSISVLLCLSFDLKADWQRVTGVSIMIAVMFTLMLLNLEKPFRRWYRENYDRSYRYNKMKPIVKDRKLR